MGRRQLSQSAKPSYILKIPETSKPCTQTSPKASVLQQLNSLASACTQLQGPHRLLLFRSGVCQPIFPADSSPSASSFITAPSKHSPLLPFHHCYTYFNPAGCGLKQEEMVMICFAAAEGSALHSSYYGDRQASQEHYSEQCSAGTSNSLCFPSQSLHILKIYFRHKDLHLWH